MLVVAMSIILHNISKLIYIPRIKHIESPAWSDKDENWSNKEVNQGVLLKSNHYIMGNLLNYSSRFFYFLGRMTAA